MKQRVWALALAAALLLGGCAPQAPSGPVLHRYEASFLTLFDTVTTIVGYDACPERDRPGGGRLLVA